MVTRKHTWLEKSKQNHKQENFRSSNSKSWLDDCLCDGEEIQNKSNGMCFLCGEPACLRVTPFERSPLKTRIVMTDEFLEWVCA